MVKLCPAFSYFLGICGPHEESWFRAKMTFKSLTVPEKNTNYALSEEKVKAKEFGC